MANFDLYFPKILKFEGIVYENDPVDTGGCTKFGLVLQDLIDFHLDKDKDGNYDCNDVKQITKDDASVIYKKIYWDYFKADNIINQSIAEYIVDGGINQGNKTIAKYIQNILGLDKDGIVGEITLNAINSHNQEDLYNKLKKRRIDKYNAIVSINPTQSKFIKGWLNRVKAIDYIG